MGQTIIEKIFSDHVGRRIEPLENVMVEPDLTCAYEL